MPADDLFPEAVGLSPRLAWMARHDIVTARTKAGKWYAILTAETVGEGADELAALDDLVLRTGLKHWTV
jgi:hypothetical protein